MEVIESVDEEVAMKTPEPFSEFEFVVSPLGHAECRQVGLAAELRSQRMCDVSLKAHPQRDVHLRKL
jgi:hypothetical protein